VASTTASFPLCAGWLLLGCAQAAGNCFLRLLGDLRSHKVVGLVNRELKQMTTFYPSICFNPNFILTNIKHPTPGRYFGRPLPAWI
jgi:hypothetical protein